MLNRSVHEALNNHVAKEFYASYLYLSMAAHFEHTNLPGFARWMVIQSSEERDHAMKFYDYLNDRGARVTLQPITQPPSEFTSPLTAFEQALAHEQQVTAEINQLYALASEMEDYATQAFLQWFVTEQVEEEKTASQIVETLKLIGDDKPALLMLDRELGARSPAGAA